MWCLFLWIVLPSAIAEIITLSRNNEITCVVTKNIAESTVFISPPVDSGFNKNSVEILDWVTDDWNTVNSVNSDMGVVTDKRWEDFTMLRGDAGYALKEKSLSFSMCVSGNVSLNVFSSDFSYETWLDFTPKNIEFTTEQNTCKWFHFTITKENDSVQIFYENKLNHTYKLDFTPYWFYFKHTQIKNTFWKLHNYDFRQATTITQEDKSTVSINLTNNLCLSLYVSVDKNCFLDVSLESRNNITEQTILGFNEQNSLKTWRRIQIQAEHPGPQTLSFYRGRTQPGSSNGYWAIDEITPCNQNIDIKHVTLDEEEQSTGQHICEFLNESNDFSLDDSPNIMACNRPGFLGETCNISCSTILGSSYPYCEGFTICNGASSCFCGWGYQGDNCEKTCDDGTWGLFCKNKCKPECAGKCYPTTGKCQESDEPSPEIVPIKKLTEDDLPTHISIISNKVHIYLPTFVKEVDEDLTYTVKYSCTNSWCADKIQQERSFVVLSEKSIIIDKIEQYTPFTTYTAIVKAQRLNESVEKKYEITRKDHAFRTNFSIFSSDSKNLWVRFLNPNLESTMDVAPYKIWYYNTESNQKPMFVPTASCTLWKDFICGKIENLESDAFYSIIVEAIGTGYERWGLSKTFFGFTAEKASQAVENLELVWSSSYDTMLRWNYPSVTNGPLQKFVVEVKNDNTVESYTQNVDIAQEVYQYQLQLDNSSLNIITVGPFNNFEGERNTISATLIRINPQFSADTDVMIETCSTKSTCYLMIPKPKELANVDEYFILGVPSNETIDIETDFESEKISDERYEKGWVILRDRGFKDSFCQIDIGITPKQLDFLGKHKDYSFYYVINSSDGTYSVYPIKTSEKEAEKYKSPTLASAPFITLIAALILMSLLLSMLLLRLTRRNQKKIMHDVHLTERQTLTSNNEHQNKFTKIDIRLLEKYLKHALHSGKDLGRQFRSLSGATKPTIHAFQAGNKNKNKDEENVPYDHNRVILETMEGMGTDDYINASYIDGFERKNAYIATQGPKFYTIRDFWRMIWKENVETIIMATNFMENKKRKCAEYFPQSINETFECGEMIIKLINIEAYEHHVARFFEVYYRRTIRTVQHFQLNWNPDDLTPLYANCVAPLVKKISAIREKSNKPIVIHCSSGVNRTGTLILCDLALQMAKTEKSVDFYTLIKNLRDQRPNMISSEKQYILAHLVVLECLMEKENVFKKSVRENLLFSPFKKQFNYLARLSWHDDVVQTWSTRHNEYCNYLLERVDGYGANKKFVTTQQPTKSSIHAFWNMIVQEKIYYIIFLNKQNTQIYPYHVTNHNIFISVKELQAFQTTYCTVTNLLLQVLQTNTNTIIFQQTVYLCEANNCDKYLNINNTNKFLNILEDMNKKTYKKPVLVACHDGITDNGVFVALDYIIEKCKYEFDVDVCNGIRNVRRSGIPFIKTPPEMEFLYTAVVEYLQKFDEYSCIL